MHDSTRRLVTLFLFVVLGPILTIGIVVNMVARRSASHLKYHETEFSTLFGMSVTLASVEYTKPGQFRYQNMRVYEPQTKNLFAEIPNLQLTQLEPYQWTSVLGESSGNPPPSAIGQYWQCKIDQMTVYITDSDIRNSSLPTFFLDLLNRRNQGPPLGVVLDVTQVDFDTSGITLTQPKPLPPDSPQGNSPQMESPPFDSLQTVYGYVNQPGPDMTSCAFEFSLRDNPTAERLLLSGSRVDGKTGPFLRWMFAIHEKDTVPLPLLAAMFPPFRNFGEFCWICGSISAEKSPGTPAWSFQLKNVCFRDADLWKLTEGITPYRIAGSVKGFNIDTATIDQGILRQASGFIDVFDGSIEKNLLEEFVRRFSLQISPENAVEQTARWVRERNQSLGVSADSSNDDVDIPFDRCWGYFSLSDRGLFFRPVSSDKPILEFNQDNQERLRLFIGDSEKPVALIPLLAAMQPPNTQVGPVAGPLIRILQSLPPMIPFGNQPPRKQPFPGRPITFRRTVVPDTVRPQVP